MDQNNTKEIMDSENQPLANAEKIYDVEFLLDRAYGSFTINVGKLKLIAPKCKNENKKTYIINFPEVCESMNRDPEELRKFISKELQMDTSIKGTGFLKINGILKNPKIIETLVRNFIIEHVMCKTCRSCKTKTEKETGGRIVYMICTACGCKKAI